MANPPPYNPSYSFSGWQASNPSKPLPADRVDNEYASISISLNATITAIGDIRRSDGQLQNGIVGVDALSTGISPGFVLRGQWAGGTHYLTADSVVYNNIFYRANVAHDSSAANRPDVDAATWTALFSVGSLSGAMSAFIYDPNNHLADAFARGNHTGVQAISTITGLQTALDTLTNSKLALAGGTMSGDLDMGGNDVRNVLTLNDGPLSGTRNKIINGDFDIWQRATSQTLSGYGSDDRWLNENVGSTKVASRQTFTLGQTAVPGNPQFFARTVVTTVAGAGNYVRKTQRIEGVRTLAGKTVTLTLHGTADASRNIAVEFVQNFGTGGSPSAAVTGIGSQQMALTTTPAKKTVTINIPSIAGKTLGSNANDYLELVIWFDAGTTFNARAANLGQQSGTFDIAHVSVVEGNATQEADPFGSVSVANEQLLCDRFFQKITNVLLGGYGIASSSLFANVARRTRMRTAPTTSAANIANVSNMTTLGLTTSSQDAFAFTAAIVAAGTGSLTFDVNSDAEL